MTKLKQQIKVILNCLAHFSLACSRLRDSGESVNWEKECEKRAKGLGSRHRPHFSRFRASYFRVPFLIFVPSQLSESLEQANFSHIFVYNQICISHSFFHQNDIHIHKFILFNLELKMFCTCNSLNYVACNLWFWNQSTCLPIYWL